MTSDSGSCNGYFSENRNTEIGNYFAATALNPNKNDMSHLDGSSRGNIRNGNNSSSSSSNSSGGGGSGSSCEQQNSGATTDHRWNEHITSSSSTTSSTSSSGSQQQHHDDGILNRIHHQQQQQQQHHHFQQQHQQSQQQQQQHQQQHQIQQQITNQSNLPLPPPTNSTNLIFGSGNFHHRTNNTWTMPSISCYQRIYNDNHYMHGGGFNNNNNSSNNTASNQNLNSSHPNSNSDSNNNNNNSNCDNSVVNHHLHHLHQQNNKRFLLQQGKTSGNSKDICGDDKFKEDGDPWNVEAQAAFLGPNLWDKTLPYDADLKVTQYADLDEFLSENNIPDGLPGTHLGHSTGLGHRSDSLGHSTGLSSLGLGHVTTKRERSPSPSDCVSPDTINPPSPAESTFSFASSGRDFDPRTRAFSDEELKPQPMIKKSRKQFVPDELKDDKYWARRRKNNIAAKRSRDARRQKENQIAMRARYLEKENATLHQEVEQLKQENMDLRTRLSKYQEV